MTAPQDADGNYGDVKLVAYWTDAPKVKLDYQGGSSSSHPADMESTFDGSDFKLDGSLPQPTKAYYHFNKWVYAGTTTPVDPQQLMVTGSKEAGFDDVNIVALWTKLPLLSLDPTQGTISGGSAPQTVHTEIAADGTVKLTGISQLPIPQVPDSSHAFWGWLDSSNQEVGFDDISFAPDSSGQYDDVNLHARWVKLPELEFDSAGGSPVTEVVTTVLTPDGSVKVAGGQFPVSVRIGYRFKGWVDAAGSPVDPNNLPVSLQGDDFGKLKLTAQWVKSPILPDPGNGHDGNSDQAGGSGSDTGSGSNPGSGSGTGSASNPGSGSPAGPGSGSGSDTGSTTDPGSTAADGQDKKKPSGPTHPSQPAGLPAAPSGPVQGSTSANPGTVPNSASKAPAPADASADPSAPTAASKTSSEQLAATGASVRSLILAVTVLAVLALVSFLLANQTRRRR